MRKIKILFISLLAACSFYSYGQAPGYRGDDFSAGLTFGLMPDFTSFIYDKDPWSTHYASGNPVGVILRGVYGIEGEYAVGEHVSLLLSYSRSHLSYRSNGLTALDTFSNVYGFYNYDINYLQSSYQVNNSYIDLSVKLFKAGGIAPLGSYVKLGAGISESNYTITVEGVPTATGFDGEYSGSGSVSHLSLLFGLGKTFIIRDKVVLDICNEYRINLASPSTSTEDGYNYLSQNSEVVSGAKFVSELIAVKVSVRGIFF